MRDSTSYLALLLVPALSSFQVGRADPKTDVNRLPARLQSLEHDIQCIPSSSASYGRIPSQTCVLFKLVLSCCLQTSLNISCSLCNNKPQTEQQVCHHLHCLCVCVYKNDDKAVSRSRGMTTTFRKSVFGMENSTLVPELCRVEPSQAKPSNASGKAPIEYGSVYLYLCALVYITPAEMSVCWLLCW